jgi:hypothetical protein
MVGQTISRYKITENWASSKQIVGVRHLFGVVSFSEGERNAAFRWVARSMTTPTLWRWTAAAGNRR